MNERCHVCGPLKQDPPTRFCGPCAIEQIGKATPPEGGGLVELETTRGRIAIRTDPHETTADLVRRAGVAIDNLPPEAE